MVVQEITFGYFNFNYLVVVDDSQPKIGDIVLEEYVDGTKGLEQIDTLNDIDVLLQKRITHHLPLNNAPILEGIELLPPLEDEVELAYQKELLTDNQDKNWVGYGKGINGVSKERWKSIYNKAKEVYKFTEEDMRDAYNLGLDTHSKQNPNKVYDELIQSLSQPKLLTSFDTETKQYIYENKRNYI
jgi:hypothetical protein